MPLQRAAAQPAAAQPAAAFATDALLATAVTAAAFATNSLTAAALTAAAQVSSFHGPRGSHPLHRQNGSTAPPTWY
jgi:hypothetical protein